jgi:hypothetical protein
VGGDDFGELIVTAASGVRFAYGDSSEGAARHRKFTQEHDGGSGNWRSKRDGETAKKKGGDTWRT